MPYRIDPNPTFRAVAHVASPDGCGGSFGVLFRALTVSEAAVYDFGDAGSVRDFLSRVIVEVDDVEDADGRTLPSSAEVVAQLVDIPAVRTALIAAYGAGFDAGRRGN
jgi:hypothetical protein